MKPLLKNNALNRHSTLLFFMKFSYYLTHCKLAIVIAKDNNLVL